MLVQSPSLVSTNDQNNHADSNSTSSTFSFNTTPQQSQPTPVSAIQQGVSSLSTLFGEPKYKAISNPYSFLNSSSPLSPNQPSLHSPHGSMSPNYLTTNNQQVSTPSIHQTPTTVNTASPITSPLIQTPNINNCASNSSLPSSISTVTSNQSPLTSTTTASTATSIPNESSNEKDTIIANDIETDKLLNVIEKSKGFSDFNSTQRRNRNRNNPFSVAFNSINVNTNNSLNNTSNNSINTSNDDMNNSNNSKKINKLKWNEERLEVEYRDKEEEEAALAAEQAAADAAVDAAANEKITIAPNIQLQPVNVNNVVVTSPNSNLKRQNSGLILDVS